MQILKLKNEKCYNSRVGGETGKVQIIFLTNNNFPSLQMCYGSQFLDALWIWEGVPTEVSNKTNTYILA